MIEKKQAENQPICVTQKGAGLSYSITMLAIILVVLFFSVISSVLGEKFLNSTAYQCLNYSLGGLAVMCAFFLSLLVTKTPIKAVAKFRFDIKYLPMVLLLFVGMYFGLGNVNGYLVQLLQKIGYTPATVDEAFFSPKTFLFLTVFVAIVPAVFEELVFRGLILSGLKSVGEIKAVLISALAFSLYHMSIEKTIYQFLAGVIFSLIALKTNSLIFTMIIHFLNNFVVIVNYCFFKLDFSVVAIIIMTVLGVICLVIGLVLALRKTKFNKGEQNSKFWWIYSLIGLFVAFSLWLSNLVAS